MKSNVHWGPVSIWHHRILGGLWSLCGLVFIGTVVRFHSWSEVPTWVAVFLGAAYMVTGIGFVRLRTWARRAMGILMVVAALYFLDMMMMAGVGGNRQGVYEMLIVAGIAGYTLAFVVISALWYSEGSP